MKDLKKLTTPLLMSLTLGLAPFTPPHIIGKIQWVLGGADGMQPMDYFDLVFHGAPWVYLIVMLIAVIRTNLKSAKSA